MAQSPGDESTKRIHTWSAGVPATSARASVIRSASSRFWSAERPSNHSTVMYGTTYASEGSISATTRCLGTAPWIVWATLPPLKRSSVGMAMML